VPKLTAKDVIKAERLQTIEGTVPRPTALPPGCHFEPRCHFRMPRCREGEIPLYDVYAWRAGALRLVRSGNQSRADRDSPINWQ